MGLKTVAGWVCLCRADVSMRALLSHRPDRIPDVAVLVVHQAHRFALDPTPTQQRDLLSHCGAARFAYNWALAAVKANLDQRAAERSYGVSEDELTPAPGWSLPALRRAWNQAMGEVASWWRECSKEAFNTGLDSVAGGCETLIPHQQCWTRREPSTGNSGLQVNAHLKFTHFATVLADA